jgi:hypothetical protein
MTPGYSNEDELKHFQSIRTLTSRNAWVEFRLYETYHTGELR